MIYRMNRIKTVGRGHRVRKRRRTGMKTITLIAIAVTFLAAQGNAADTETKNKNITVITGQSSADGKSEIREQLLEECIVSLPSPEGLEAIVQSQPQFLKEINGNPNQNDFVKTFTASIDINYMVYQKVLYIVTTSSVSGVEPTMKVMEKHIRQSKQFVSDPANGDLYAGRSRREYYFSSSETAVGDARKQAQVWLKQQAPTVCKPSAAK
jgi:hypothetical protein